MGTKFNLHVDVHAKTTGATPVISNALDCSWPSACVPGLPPTAVTLSFSVSGLGVAPAAACISFWMATPSQATLGSRLSLTCHAVLTPPGLVGLQSASPPTDGASRVTNYIII